MTNTDQVRKDTLDVKEETDKVRIDTAKVKDSTILAKEDAIQATTRANNAALISETLNAHQPLMQVNEENVLTWWVWDLEQEKYIDTTLPARGLVGKAPVVLKNGNYGNWDEALQEYVDSEVEALATVDLDNIPVEFEQAEKRETILTGETVPTVFGKLKNWLSYLSNLGLLAWKDTVDYNSDIDNLPHIPEDQIQSDYQQEDDAQRDYIKNKPFIPSATSDIKNDTDLQNGSQVSKSISLHNTSGTAHEDIRGKLSEVEAIARGKARANIFDTVEDLDEWLSNPENLKNLQVGDNFYIKATDVPDYWWDGEQKQKLETEKPDLSIFYNKDESNSRFSFKPIQKTTVLLPEDWIEEEENNQCLYSVQDNDVFEGSFLEAWPIDKESKEAASKIDIYENVIVLDGVFSITAEQKPSKPISIAYTIIR